MDHRQAGREELTHAGGVVRRQGDDGPAFLIVRASRPPYEWVLPKGHIESGETPEQAARREVLEEAGVDAEVVMPIGDEAFDVDATPVRVRFFLMRYLQAGTASERREIRWCPPDEAERLLAFDSAREMVRRAAALSGPGA